MNRCNQIRFPKCTIRNRLPERLHLSFTNTTIPFFLICTPQPSSELRPLYLLLSI
ncbi:hypothetical protein Hanom_Chr05g00449431 [Helianthus anomalus]